MPRYDLIGMFRIARQRSDIHGRNLTAPLEALLECQKLGIALQQTQRVAVRLGSAPDALWIERQYHQALAPLALELLDARSEALRHALADLADEGVHRSGGAGGFGSRFAL